MGIMSKILGGGENRSVDDYEEIELDDLGEAPGGAGMQVYFAEIGDKGDVIPIKDAVYDGDLVVADVTRHTTSDRTAEHIKDELTQVADEVGGDIVQRGDDQLVIAPTGVNISREKLN